MTIGKSPSTRPLRRLLFVAALCGVAAVAACGTSPAEPPPGAISDDRSLGDILVSFTSPPVTTSLQAGEVLQQIKGPVRFVVKRPMSGGVWLVTAITAQPDATMDQALATLRGQPRIEHAEPDRMLRPHRTIPPGRDMPAD